MVDIPILLKQKYTGDGFKLMREDAKKTAKHNEKVFRDSQGRLRNAQGRFVGGGGAGGAGFGALALGAGAAAGILALSEAQELAKESIKLARIQIEAEEQLQATLESTGYAAGFSRRELIDMAGALQQVTNYGDEATIQAQALLGTFTNIKGVQFEKTLVAAMDVASKRGAGLNTTIEQLGRTLNDPKNNLSALSRSGIQFTESQKAMIKELQDSNRLLEAQDIILQELEKQYGGSAEAARDSLTGLSNAWGDVKESIGFAITPSEEFVATLETGAGTLAGFTRGLSDLDKVTDTWVDSAIEAKFGADSWAQSIRDLTNWFTPDPLVTYIGLLTGNESVREAYDEVKGSAIEAGKEVVNFSNKLGLSEDNLKDLAKANEEIAKERERVNGIERDAIRALIDIEEDAYDKRIDAAGDFQKTIRKIQDKAAKDAKGDGKKLTAQLEAIDDDTKAKLKKNRKDAEKAEKNERKMAAVEAIGDKRLFDLQIKNMAEDGDSIGIERARERRAIEEEIAREKATAEGQIQEQAAKDEQETIKKTAAARKQELQDSAALENELRKEELAQRIQDEAGYFTERQAMIEKGKNDAIATVAAELVEVSELTKSQLMNLAQQTYGLGVSVASPFARGLVDGFRQEGQISQVQNFNTTVNANGPGAGAFGDAMADISRNHIMQFNEKIKQRREGA